MSLPLLVIFTLILWGTEYTFIGFVTPSIGESWQVAIRLVFASFLMVLFVLARGHRFPHISDKSWLWYGVMGFVGMSIPFYLIAKAYSYGVDSGLLSILIGATPLFTVGLAHIFVPSEPLTKIKLLGFFIGFIGICVLFLPKDLSLSLIENWQAQTLVIIAAFAYATTSILGKNAPKQPASTGAAIMLIGGAISAIIGAYFFDKSAMPNKWPTTQIIFALIALTLGATFLGNLFYLKLLKISGPSLIAKINYIVPLIAIISGILFLGEKFQIRYIIALMIISFGLYIAKKGEIKATL